MSSKICPICKEQNNCSVQENSCWCFETKVPKELIALLNQDEVNKSCICKTCVLEFTNNKKNFLEKFKKTL